MARACYRPDQVYLSASYKGVPFYVVEASSEHGRREATAEFPWGEQTAYADMGIKLRTYSIRAEFRENTHVEDSQALIEACESPGPGTLVHPTRGPLTVGCRSCRVSDDIETGAGYTTVDLEFVEAQDFQNVFGAASINGLNISSFVNDAIGYLGRTYQPQTAIFYEVQPLIGAMSSAVQVLGSGYARVPNPEISILADFTTLRQDPYPLADIVTAQRVIQNGFILIDNAIQGEPKSQIMQGIASSVSGYAAVDNPVRLIAAVYYARSLLEFRPDSINTGMAQYRTAVSLLSGVVGPCDDPEMYLSIQDIKISIEYQLLQRAFASPALIEYTFPGSLPSLSAAYEIYGDAKRFAEIENGNQGFPWAVGPSIVAGR